VQAVSDEAGGFDPGFDALCQRNDAERKASSADHSDEIKMLERALSSAALNPYFSTAGMRTMRQRLLILKAAAGLLPLK
jgi:hypothetical protein